MGDLHVFNIFSVPHGHGGSGHNRMHHKRSIGQLPGQSRGSSSRYIYIYIYIYIYVCVCGFILVHNCYCSLRYNTITICLCNFFLQFNGNRPYSSSSSHLHSSSSRGSSGNSFGGSGRPSHSGGSTTGKYYQTRTKVHQVLDLFPVNRVLY